MEATNAYGFDPEVGGALEGWKVLGRLSLWLSTREMHDAIWPRLRGARS